MVCRSAVCCKEGVFHTPLSPGKTVARTWAFSKASKYKDLITISHGAFDTLCAMEYHGRIFACDIDWGVRQRINIIRQDKQYPSLKIEYPQGSVQTTVRDYCKEHVVANLGMVDLDLAFTKENGFPILKDVLSTLLENKSRCKVFFTFRNGRDNTRGVNSRLEWIRQRLPNGVRLTDHYTYYSSGVSDTARNVFGAPMCVVELDVGLSIVDGGGWWPDRDAKIIDLTFNKGWSQERIAQELRKGGHTISQTGVSAALARLRRRGVIQ